MTWNGSAALCGWINQVGDLKGIIPAHTWVQRVKERSMPGCVSQRHDRSRVTLTVVDCVGHAKRKGDATHPEMRRIF